MIRLVGLSVANAPKLESRRICLLKLSICVAAALASAFGLSAQTEQNNLFAGTWKLNVAKSKFDPGPAPKSETVTIPAAAGKVEVHDMSADGKEIDWSYPVPLTEGATVPIDGLEGATVSGKNTSAQVVDHTWKRPDFNGTGHGVLSKEGKVVTYTMRGTNGQGKPVHNVLIFEKQ